MFQGKGVQPVAREQVRNQLGTLVGAKSFLRGTQKF